MCLLIETLAIVNKKPQNLYWHNLRFNQSRKACFGIHRPILLEDYIKTPTELQPRLYKCRIIYGKTIEQINLIPYQIQPITSVNIIINNQITYPYKYQNREFFNQLQQKNKAKQDTLIIKNNLITDFTYANIALFNGTEWHTPQHCLLEGTMRNQLIHQKIIKPTTITLKDLNNYTHFKRINAMLGFNHSPTYSTQIIHTNPI